MRILISNPTIVSNGKQFQGSIVINDGKIVEILRENEFPRAECDEIVEATGLYLIPGVIDDHVHFREPGLTHTATMASESRAAAASLSAAHATLLLAGKLPEGQSAFCADESGVHPISAPQSGYQNLLVTSFAPGGSYCALILAKAD